MWDNASMESIIHTTTSTKTDAPLVDSRRRSSNGHYFQHSFLEIKPPKRNRRAKRLTKGRAEDAPRPRDDDIVQCQSMYSNWGEAGTALVMDQLQAGLWKENKIEDQTINVGSTSMKSTKLVPRVLSSSAAGKGCLVLPAFYCLTRCEDHNRLQECCWRRPTS